MSCVYRTVQSFGYKFWDFAIFNRESFIFKSGRFGNGITIFQNQVFSIYGLWMFIIGA